VNEEILGECRRLMPWGTFSLCRNGAPLDFPPATFDLVVAFSVFSHLSPAAHRHWLREFHRVLRPGGTAIVTTLSRTFLDRCLACAERPQSDLDRHIGALVATAYPDWRTKLPRWDAREYLYLPSGGGLAGLEPDHYGWAMVPLRYALEHWQPELEVVDYVDDPGALAQAYFVLRKPFAPAEAYASFSRQ